MYDVGDAQLVQEAEPPVVPQVEQFETPLVPQKLGRRLARFEPQQPAVKAKQTKIVRKAEARMVAISMKWR